ncbi:MAG: hypothetical protein IT486_04315 [Gammaproteobacteria bacterium]|nr:hypothetical protein [Gammaproteobacteria bacterium]
MKLGNDPASALALSALERAVLREAARRLGADGAGLAMQTAAARITGRTHSGVGFVTRLQVPETVLPLAAPLVARIRAVHASHPMLPEPVEFVLQVRDGRLASIEAFSPVGQWPADEAAFRVTGAATSA